MSAVPKMLSEKDAAETLGVSVVTLRRWRAEGRIGFIRLGRKINLRNSNFVRDHGRKALIPSRMPPDRAVTGRRLASRLKSCALLLAPAHVESSCLRHVRD